MKDIYTLSIKGFNHKSLTLTRTVTTLVGDKEVVSVNTMAHRQINSSDLIDKLIKILGELKSGEYQISRDDALSLIS